MTLSAASVGAILLAGGATFAGALPMLYLRRLNDWLITVLLGFGGGVMLAATAFSLLLPGIDAASQRYGNKFVVALVICLLVGTRVSASNLWPAIWHSARETAMVKAMLSYTHTGSANG